MKTVSDILEKLDKQRKVLQVLHRKLFELNKNTKLMDGLDRDFRIVFRSMELVFEEATEHDLDAPSIILLDCIDLYCKAVQVLSDKVKDNGLNI